MLLTVIRMAVFWKNIYKNIKKLNNDWILILNRNQMNFVWFGFTVYQPL